MIEFNLLDELEKQTESKEFSSTPATPPAEATASDFWGSENDFEPEPEPTPELDTDQPEPSPEPSKLTEKAKLAGARTATGMIDLTHKSILNPIANWKFKKKFSKTDIEKLDKIEDADPESLNDEDKKLQRKWERLLKKHVKTVEAIPLTDEEEKDLTEAFYQYFDFTNKSLSPSWFIAFAIINTTGKRITDLAFD